jgi:S1-C subfamily serine protease
MRAALTCVLLALAASAAAENPPVEATVFIRVAGPMRAEYQQGLKEKVETEEVELATGSGFVISPAGYVLTSNHVVTGREFTVERAGQRVKVSAEVKTVEVVFPDGRRLEAAVAAADPDLDLAVLSVPASDLPFIRLGDSDALQPGDAVQVIGFPLGRDVEVARTVTAETVPQASFSRGTVAALRASDEGEARYIQTDATINPGSSGGPMLDEDGYAVGVVRMKLRPASGVGFAVPINLVKDFLEARGLDRVFPGRRLRLGPLQSYDWKGIRLRTAEGLQDVSPARLRVDSGAGTDEVTLLVDRAYTPFSLADLETRLLSGALGGIVASAPRRTRAVRIGSRPARVGSARGEGTEMEYAILDLGREKVLARYFGPDAQIAFNRSVLRDSLESLEADALITAELKAAVPPTLERALLPRPDAPIIAMPRGWAQEAAPPIVCRGLPPPDSALAASPAEDFTVTVRAGWRPSGPAPEEAAEACVVGSRLPRGEYWRRVERLGVAYGVHGTFVRRSDGLLQLEVEAPLAKRDYVEDLFAAWVKALSP